MFQFNQLSVMHRELLMLQDIPFRNFSSFGGVDGCVDDWSAFGGMGGWMDEGDCVIV